MTFCRLLLMCVFGLVFIVSDLAFAKIKVSSYGGNSAVKVHSTKAGVVNPASVVATSESSNLQVLGFWFVNNGLTYSDDIVVMRVAFNNFLFDSSDGSVTVDDINLLAGTEPALIGDPLFYPSPFRFSEGGTLQYYLSTPMDITIQMYNIFGHRVYERDCAASSECGLGTKNEITFDSTTTELNGNELSAGVYFYLLIYEDEVLGRGKVAVVP